jgi:hypothetical protein
MVILTANSSAVSFFVGAARWQAGAFQLGVVMSAAGGLVMLLTALKSFGAAELLGQVNRHTTLFLFLFCRPLNVVMTLLRHANQACLIFYLTCICSVHVRSNVANGQKQGC